MTQTKTQRLINRIEEKESFYDIAYICDIIKRFFFVDSVDDSLCFCHKRNDCLTTLIIP